MRGQTLVLFVLTLLLLTLLVLMTIGLGVRLHERTEQQVVADAAAYSQAVVTARTFNVVSSLNRTIIAQMSAVAAAQSLLSWAGYYHGTLNQGRDLLADMMANGPAACSGPLKDAHDRIMAEDRRLIDLWEPPGGGYEGIYGYDRDSANYIRNVVYKTALTLAEDQKDIYRQMTRSLGGIADDIAADARKGSPWGDNDRELYAADQSVTQQERDDAVVPLQRAPKHMVRATMATRGLEHFISSREGTKLTHDLSAADYVAKRLNRVMDPSPLVAVVTDFGTSYFGEKGPMRSTGPAEIEGYDGQAIQRPAWQHWRDLENDGRNLTYLGAWAQDVGVFHFDWTNPPPGCKLKEPTEDSFGYIVTTGPRDARDNHMWRRGDRYFGDYREWNDSRVSDPPLVRHSFREVPQDATGLSIWPVFVDYREAALRGGNAAANADGQPKSLVPIVRDYSARTGDPWELHFRFRFSRSEPGEKIDLRSNRGGMDRGIAIASGLTYYHRGAAAGGKDHSKEPPNFLNPFWRATLVASDVDEPYGRRGDDIINALEGLRERDQANALRLLRAKGFEAIP
ncbi:MAG: hypothetical protein ACJ8AT_06685 [Hyalangium sp.]|uniref:hypothetical protein n=1 Tax=Hyalangium sp. TaxID=2028555 RepID=UPI003899D82A